MEQPLQKRPREDQFLEHYRRAQEAYHFAIEAVSQAESEIDSIPAVDVHLAVRLFHLRFTDHRGGGLFGRRYAVFGGYTRWSDNRGNYDL